MTKDKIKEVREYYRSGKHNQYHGGHVYSVVNDLLKEIEKRDKVIEKMSKALGLKKDAELSIASLNKEGE